MTCRQFISVTYTTTESQGRRVKPEIQAIEDVLGATVDGQADDVDAYEPVVANSSAPGVAESDCYSEFSEHEESHPLSD